MTSLTREGSFGEAAEQMAEQHGQGVDRTLVQRVRDADLPPEERKLPARTSPPRKPRTLP